LGSSLSKMKVKYEDCTVKKKRLTKETAKQQGALKANGVKINDQETTITRLKTKIKELQGQLSGAKAVIKSNKRTMLLCSRKKASQKAQITEMTNKLKTMKDHMGASEGALMGEIARNKKTIRAEKERSTVLGNSLAKRGLTLKKQERKLNRKIVKTRELGGSVYHCKRSLDTMKAKYTRIKQLHGTSQQRLRDTRSKLALCQDRINDAKVKSQGCKEALRRMKTYTADTINQQRMDKTALRQKLGMELKKAHALELSRAEKVKANKLAKAAAEKAASQAVSVANAKALAAKHSAKEQVAAAAREAVKMADAKAHKLAHANAA